MDIDDEAPDTSSEIGSDELLSDDSLRLPEGASILVRLHAVRAWLMRRKHDAGIAVGAAALDLQRAMLEEPQETRPRRRERQEQQERLQRTQQAFAEAQQRLNAYEEAQSLLEDCIAHTSGERVLVEYYLALDELVNNTPADQPDSLPRLRALADVQRRIEHICIPEEE